MHNHQIDKNRIVGIDNAGKRTARYNDDRARRRGATERGRRQHENRDNGRNTAACFFEEGDQYAHEAAYLAINVPRKTDILF